VQKVSKTGIFSAFFGNVPFWFSQFSKRAKKMIIEVPFDIARKTENPNPNWPKMSKNFNLDFVFGPEKSKRGPVQELGRSNEGPV